MRRLGGKFPLLLKFRTRQRYYSFISPRFHRGHVIADALVESPLLDSFEDDLSLPPVEEITVGLVEGQKDTIMHHILDFTLELRGTVICCYIIEDKLFQT